MPRGSLWIADVGDFALTWLTRGSKPGVSVLLGDQEPVTLCNAAGQRVEGLDRVPSQEQDTVEGPVSLGVGPLARAPKARGGSPAPTRAPAGSGSSTGQDPQPTAMGAGPMGDRADQRAAAAAESR